MLVTKGKVDSEGCGDGGGFYSGVPVENNMDASAV